MQPVRGLRRGGRGRVPARPALRGVPGATAGRQPADRLRRRRPHGRRQQGRPTCSPPGVAAVQKDALRKPLTDSSPRFIGAPTLYSQLGGAANAGKGVIVGVLDTGAWPEHPSFADHGNLRRRRRQGRRHPADLRLRRQPADPGDDVFVCNNKLIGGQPFLDTYDEVIGFGDERLPGQRPRLQRPRHPHRHHRRRRAGGQRQPARGRPRADQRHRPRRVRGRLQGLRHRRAASAPTRPPPSPRPSWTGSSRSTSRSPAAPTRSATRSSWPSSTPTRPVCSCRPRPATPAPAPGTVDHRRPWVTTVAASTQKREFQSTLTLTRRRRHRRP